MRVHIFQKNFLLKFIFFEQCIVFIKSYTVIKFVTICPWKLVALHFHDNGQIAFLFISGLKLDSIVLTFYSQHLCDDIMYTTLYNLLSVIKWSFFMYPIVIHIELKSIWFFPMQLDWRISSFRVRTEKNHFFWYK